MLNLSSNRIDNKIDKKAYASFSETKDYKAARIFARTLIKLLVVFVLLLFLPWTQNIRSRGYVRRRNRSLSRQQLPMALAVPTLLKQTICFSNSRMLQAPTMRVPGTRDSACGYYPGSSPAAPYAFLSVLCLFMCGRTRMRCAR